MNFYCNKDCPNRKPGCHATCEIYARAAEKRREITSAMREQYGVFAEYRSTRKPTRRRKGESE